MPANLDPETGWQLVFADEEDRSHLFILSDRYLNDTAKSNNREEEARKWTWFFKQLGVTDAPEMPFYEVKDPNTSNRTNYFEKEILLKNFRCEFDKKYPSSRTYPSSEVLQNYRPPKWLQELAEQEEKTIELLGEKLIVKRAIALVNWLEKQPKPSLNSIPTSFTAKYSGSYRGNYSDKTDSQFKHILLKTGWFPSTQGLKKPQDVFVDSPTFQSLLGDAVPYSIKKVTQYPKAISWLQLNQDARPDNLVKYLRSLSKEIPDQSMLKQVEKIFRFLSNTSDSSLYHYFFGEKIILVSNPTLKWVSLSDVIWPDLSGIFGDTYSYLEVDYKDLRNFFVGKLNVKAEVDTQQYADALRKMWSTTTDAAKVEKVLERIYPRLKEEARKVEKPTWWWELCRDIKVWTKSDKFVAPSQVYIQDDPELEKLFTKQGVDFVWRPEKSSLAEYKQLYTAFGIKSLVERVELELVDCLLDNSFSENQYLTSYTKKMICYYLWNEHKEVYERLKNDPNLLPALLKTKEQEVENLRIAYKLAGKRVEIPESPVYWDLGQGLLYTNTSSEPKVDIPIEIARKLIRANNLGDVKKDALEDFIGSKLSMSEQAFNRTLQKKGHDLPEEEKAWVESLLGAANNVVEQTEEAFTESNEDLLTQDVTQKDDSFTLAVPENGGIVQPTHKTAFDISRPIQSSVGSSTNHSGTAGHKNSSDTASYHNSGKSTDSSSNTSTYISSSSTTKDVTEPKVNNNGEVVKISNLAQPSNTLGKRPVLRSYVLPSNSSLEGTIDEENEISEEERNQIDRKGIEKVLEYERRNGRSPEELEHNHPGWDINSYEVNENGERGKYVRHIEVKSTKYNWDGYGVGISSTQFEKAWELGDDYYLYVVESVLDEQNFKLTVIQNPVKLIANYRFDGGWKVFVSERFSPDAE